MLWNSLADLLFWTTTLLKIWRSWSNPKFGFQIEIICINNICTQGISQQTLQSLIDFIYTGRVALCQENVQVFILIPIYSVLWLGKLPGFHFLIEGCPHIFKTFENNLFESKSPRMNCRKHSNTLKISWNKVWFIF